MNKTGVKKIICYACGAGVGILTGILHAVSIELGEQSGRKKEWDYINSKLEPVDFKDDGEIEFGHGDNHTALVKDRDGGLQFITVNDPPNDDVVEKEMES